MPRGVYPSEKRKGLFQKGHKGLNTGRTWLKGGERKGSKHSDESKDKMSKARKGKIPSNIESLRSYKRPRGKDSHMWKGGKTDESKIWRTRVEYITWRKAVFERDDYTCQKCKVRGGSLAPHHIRNFAEDIENRFNVANGITLCLKHHKEFHKLFCRIKNNQTQIDEYIKDN